MKKHLNAPGNPSPKERGKDNKPTTQDALSILQELKQNENRRLYPNVPEIALPKPKYSDRNANGLTHCITDYLRLKGFYAVRINTQGNYNGKLKKWVKSGVTPGTPDITAIVNGQSIQIEVKHGKDRLSEAQIKQAAKIQAAGGIYYVATSFNDFFNWFNKLANHD